ncbi:relaxase, partial [Pseudomonas aeruginosa]|nr:relaxase [Pseudomonas aeruginosa]
PALIWESGERPAPFAGTVAIDATLAENDASAPATPPAVVMKPAQEDQGPRPWEGGSAAALAAPPTAHQALPDALEDMLTMVGMGDSSGTQQDAEVVSSMTPA